MSARNLVTLLKRLARPGLVGLGILVLSMTHAPATLAAVISFTVTPYSGPLSGNNYYGTFEYDATQISPTGTTYADFANGILKAITFNFNGATYTQSNATLPPWAMFADGALSFFFFENASYPFSLSFSRFNYYANEVSYNGSAVFSPVPLPAALPLLASGLASLGFVARRRRKAA